MFKPYESKPITRMAFQVTDEDTILRLYALEATYVAHTPLGSVQFKAYEEPKVGDWIVRLTENDTYHVTDTVFRERNIVPLEPEIYATGCFYCNGSKAGCPVCD